ncbi:MAG: general secretion pathway protein GspK [Aquificae bacterium]|nr:general secretion pathway protein GspK [Aquificota bacterium]
MILVVVLSLFLTLSYYVVQVLQTSSDLSRTFSSVYTKEKAYLMMDSALPRILKLLRREDATYDSLSDPWALPYRIETPVGEIEVLITDEDRYLNPNKLREVKGLEKAFLRLLRLLEIDPLLLEYVLIWTGQEEGSLPLELPIKRKPLDSLYEMELFWEKKEDLYGNPREGKEGLFSFTTVFSDGRININTAPLYVLLSLDEEITPQLAKRIIQRREEEPFKRVKDLLLVEGVTLDILYRIEGMVKTKSRFFRISMSLKGEEALDLTVVYDREKDILLYKELR